MKHVADPDFNFTDYGKVSDRFLMDLADDPTSVKMDGNNVIVMDYFYDDATNPANHATTDPELWESYFEKLKN